jgi:hypothetical protein
LFFQPLRWLEDDEYAVAVEKGQSISAKQAVTMSVSKPADKPLQLEGAKPKAKAAPVEAEEEVDEPEKRKPAVKATAVPAKKASNLASTVEEWDDE